MQGDIGWVWRLDLASRTKLEAMRRATGSIRVFTFKEGLMSAVAHDLRLELQKFEITLDGANVKCELDLQSLRVEGPMDSGVLRVEQYDDAKRADVTRVMHREVLRTREHPKSLFVGTA